MNIIHSPEQGSFRMLDEKSYEMGRIDYTRGDNGDLHATHTEVAPAQEGRGYAAQLLDVLAAYAVESGVKIVPVCPYVIHAFQKHPEKYASVMP